MTKLRFVPLLHNKKTNKKNKPWYLIAQPTVTYEEEALNFFSDQQYFFILKLFLFRGFLAISGHVWIWHQQEQYM